MVHKLALSALVVALAGGLAVAPGGRSMAATTSLSTKYWLASDVYKADVYTNAEEKIGVVTDLIMDSSGNVVTAVVGVGGFLGAGEKEVAVPFKDLKVVTRDNKDWLVLNQTKEQLNAAPAYDKKTNKPM
jgi:sporulation protein YlmC with PRC-barrel domain